MYFTTNQQWLLYYCVVVLSPLTSPWLYDYSTTNQQWLLYYRVVVLSPHLGTPKKKKTPHQSTNFAVSFMNAHQLTVNHRKCLRKKLFSVEFLFLYRFGPLNPLIPLSVKCALVVLSPLISQVCGTCQTIGANSVCRTDV